MNDIDINRILYYADFLSLKNEYKPITQNCKYFFVHGTPIHITYLAGYQPEIDMNNQYFKQAYTEYRRLQLALDDQAANSFIDDICYIRASGIADAETMFYFANVFSSGKHKQEARKKFEEWKEQQKCTHDVLDDETGKLINRECTIYIKNAERYNAEH